ncbi:FAD-dependent oxidoreductase [Streptomyces thermocarboxydus]
MPTSTVSSTCVTSTTRCVSGALKAARNVVVVGGGFIGLEAAAVARASGKEVVVVEALDRLLARAVAPVMSDFCLAAHQRRGSRILLERGVISFEGKGLRSPPWPFPTARAFPPTSSSSASGWSPHRDRRADRPPLRSRHRDRRVRPHQQPRRRGRG